MSDYADRWNAALDRQVVQPQRELRGAKKEIERLRARIEELEKELLLEMNANEEKGRRIEKLEAKVSEQVRLRAHELRTFHPEDHVTIPNDCIDKAWAKIQTRAEPVYHQGMERALEIIGIVDDGEGGWRMSDD